MPDSFKPLLICTHMCFPRFTQSNLFHTFSFTFFKKIAHCIFSEHFGDKDKQNFLLELSVKYFPFGPDSSFIHLFLAPRLLPRRLFVYCRPTIHSKGPLFCISLLRFFCIYIYMYVLYFWYLC